jgi:hypothetical protein
MLILGGLLAVVLGVCLVCYGLLGCFGNLGNGWLARGLSVGFGLIALAGGIAAWVWALNGGPVPPFPPRYRFDEIDISDLAPLTAFMIIALASGIGHLISRWLARAETRSQQQSGEQGLVFPVPYLARGPLMMVLILLLPPMVLLVLATLNRANIGVMLETGCGVPLVLSPILVFALYMLRHNSGHVALTKDAVLLRRLGRERRLRYEEILHIKDYAFGLPPDLVLRGRGRQLRIPRSVQNLPRLYQVIQQRRDALRPSEPPRFPYRMAVGVGAWVFGISVVVASVSLYVGLGLIPIWSALAAGDGLPLAPSVIRSATVLSFAIGLVFVPVIALFVIGTVKPKQPSRWAFTENEIRYRFPFQGWRTREAGELTRLYLDPVHKTVSARHEGVAVSVEMTHYALMLQFDDGLELCIDLDRALQFGSSPERLHLALNHLYPR